MTLGIDTDVLVSWIMDGALRHAEADRIIQVEIRERRALLAITPLVLQEFLHIVTDPKRFANALSMEEALQRAWGIWDSEEVVRVIPGPDVLPRTMELLSSFQLGRKRIIDTALAATFELAGIRRLATFNSGDFKIFDFLEIVNAPAPQRSFPGPRAV